MTDPFKSLKTKIKKILNILCPRMFQKKYAPLIGEVDFGDLRKLDPIDPNFGFSRGQVIDRYYIDKFLGLYSKDIHGRVLELGDNSYTKQFGGNNVKQSDVLHYVPGNPQATIVGDLTKADNLESDCFDCVILTQTLQMIYDFRSTIKNIYRILKPNGVLLLTTHGTSKICRFLGTDPWGEYWRFTSQSLKILCAEHFKEEDIQVNSYGNVLASIAFLHGLAAQDLDSKELDFHDPRYEVLVGVRALKTSFE